MSHLKYCPLKISKANKEIVTEEFTYKGWKFVVKGEKGFYDVIKKVHSRAKEKGWDSLQCLVGAIYSLYYAGIIRGFEIKPIKQS